jgi:tetratricopeptide (TPR) repeat protein
VLAELVEIRRIDGPWVDLAAALARRAELEPEPHKSDLYAELGDVYDEKLGQAADAIAAYRRALAGDPTSLRALVALRRLYRQAEAWHELADVLAQLHDALGGTADRAEVVELQVERGTILAEHLARPDDAVNAFKEALALDPQHAPAFHGLEQVFHTTGQTEQLLITTEAEVDARGAPEAHRYADLAAAWDDLLGDHDRAAACWRKLLLHDSGAQRAHEGLARALRKAARWDELVAAHRAHLEHATSPGDRIALYTELADVLDGQLGDLPGAITATQELVRLDANAAALDTLAERYERAGRYPEALAILESLLASETDPRRRAERLGRIGQIHVAARDRMRARACFEQAIALDPDSPGAHEGMARIYIAEGAARTASVPIDTDAAAAGEALVRAADLYANREDAVRCLADAAWLYRGRLGDDERAREILRRVLELDPDHRDAKRALAEVLEDAGQWETLWPHLEQQVAAMRADPSVPADKRLEVLAQAARCATELGKHAAALELYDLALAVDPTVVALQLDRADVMFRSKLWDAATKAYQNLLVQPERLGQAQIGLAYRRLGQIHDEQGKTNQAIAFHQKAIDVDPTNHESLEDLVDLHLARARYDEAIGALRAIAEAAPARRAAVLERMGDLYHRKLSNPGRATSSYLQALEVDGGNRAVLQKLLDLQTESGQWKSALETIDRFLELEKDPVRRGSYYVASASIRQEKLKDEPGALASYELALDSFFAGGRPLAGDERKRALAPFEAIDELVTSARDWKYQEQAYRRMIKRLATDDPLLVALWHALGEIYRSRLRHYESAIEAFEIAHSLDPGKSPERSRILAELYSLVGIRDPKAVTERAARLVEANPDNADAYRALAKTSLEAGRVDEAWCACRALVALKVATPAEEALYRRHQAHEVRKATGILDEEAWALVRDEDEDVVISAIFALTWDGPVALRAGPPKSFDLRAKDRMQVEGESRVIAKIFRHASRVLNAPLPDVYVQPRRSGRLLLANCVEKGVLAPAVIVGRDLMKGYRDTELAFAVGSMLALMRPAYYLRLAYPTVAELEAALAASAAIVGVKVGRPELAPQVAAFAPEIEKRLAPANTGVLAGLARRLGAAPDLARWMTAVDATARRGGLLVCGELAAATRMVASEPAPPTGPRPNEKVRDLVAYSVSPAYFAARRHIGVAIS